MLKLRGMWELDPELERHLAGEGEEALMRTLADGVLDGVLDTHGGRLHVVRSWPLSEEVSMRRMSHSSLRISTRAPGAS